ncbi:flavin-containing monooxygenase [Tellurirhabdus rosea]|uniref:flavin-containing monooxygenase n=1 Tax=Tellurirhabdus rosea TaxID=2674997 RepID=UPI0022597E1C|nr:NAD(P)-binding domain-containing protein [Tellurirhabdus rosea]
MTTHLTPTVCIIGAGSSGVTAAKTLRQHGIAFDCFEKGSDIGGNWRYDNDNGLSSAYRSLHINTNRDVMAYSDFPMPRDYPMFPHHRQILHYFESYARHFGLYEHITFRTAVTDVRRSADGCGYRVTTDTGLERDYKYVIVANGHHWNPRYPDPPFPGTFTGETLHSHDYKVPEQIRGKNLLIVGIGNSAVDIACEAARLYSGRVVISTRSGAYIVPNWLMGMPFDSLANPLTAKLPLPLQRGLLGMSLWLARGRQSAYGVPVPKRPLLSEHPTISQDLLNLAGRGLIGFKPNVREFKGKNVTFEDHTTEAFDMVIYATGYKVSFPFFGNGFFNVENSNDLQLYRRVVHPDYPGLFFLGLVQPLGAIMPLAEAQARWIARLITGECRLPDRQAMLQSLEAEKQRNLRRYKHSPRHTLQVDFHPYKQSLEREMKRR